MAPLFDDSKNAFTLIELLIVVLIIGILTAIALPQYQKAVVKSRTSEALINLRRMADAEKLYRLANGVCTTDLSQLGVLEEGKYYRYYIGNETYCHLHALSQDENLPGFEGDPANGFVYCRGTAEKCKLIGPVETPSWCGDPCDYYILPL